jgi:UDP-N-acetyl-D-mannosaminuronic acid dehydrogenase
MAALLARARLTIGGANPATVVVLQRPSASSGWKVGSINAGQSPIGGVEPMLDDIVRETVAAGLLSATHDPATVRDADVILFSVQTDKRGVGPDYGPLFAAVDVVAAEICQRAAGITPLVVFESTLAPSSLATVVRQRFQNVGLEDGRDMYLAHSPNRVMPGRLVERVAHSDKLVAGLTPEATRLTAQLYRHVVTHGTLHETNAVTAEMTKTLENAYRDVRIALAAELAAYCDQEDIDFFMLRDAVNTLLQDTDEASHAPFTVPTGALLVPMIGVGGHCLPKDGVLLWWRAQELELPTARSLILASRTINDGGPARVLQRLERLLAARPGRTIAILGVAYRGDAEDTRNAPGLALAHLLRANGFIVRLHDPHVRPDDPNLRANGLQDIFSRSLDLALDGADAVVLAAPHAAYGRLGAALVNNARHRPVFDGVQLLSREQRRLPGVDAIGRGARTPSAQLIGEAAQAARSVALGVSREVHWLATVLNDRFALEGYTAADADEVLRLVRTCPTGANLPQPDSELPSGSKPWTRSRLVQCAAQWSHSDADVISSAAI